MGSIITLSIVQSALELGFIYALVALALFVSFSILDIADLSTDGCFTLGLQIGKDNSFSKENAKCFRNISHFALLLAVVWFAGIVFLAILAVRQPGISIFMITAVLLSVMISVLAAALSHLILKAYELKQENELTI